MTPIYIAAYYECTLDARPPQQASQSLPDGANARAKCLANAIAQRIPPAPSLKPFHPALAPKREPAARESHRTP